MTETDLAWAAGFIDGEGCIYTRKPQGQTSLAYLSLAVSNTDVRLLHRLTEIFGGRAKIHPTHVTSRKPHWKQVWQWQRSGVEAGQILLAIRPYLVGKAEEADLALEFVATIGKVRGGISLEMHTERERIYWALREQKKLRGTPYEKAS